MSVQRRIDLLFTATVRVMALGRAARAASPALAMGLVVVVAVHGTLGGTDLATVPRLAMDLPPGWSAQGVQRPVEPIARAPESARAGPAPAPVASADAPVRAGAPALDREQQNIARFIAGRYRVTLDATSEFVYHAYRAARDVKLDPMLVLAVMSVESSFNPKAQSHAGAQGLMQVLTRVHAEKFLPFGGIPAAFDPVANIRVGSAILKEYLQREGSVEGALKSYVGAALAEHDGGYGMKVLNARERIAAAAAGRPIPPEVVPAVRTVRAVPRDEAPGVATMHPVPGIVESVTPLPPEEPRVLADPPAPDAAALRVPTHPASYPPRAGGAI